MFRKFLFAVATLIVTMGLAFAGADVNKADQAALDGVKGIGPKISKSILAERTKNGEFKDWADFQKRVSGIGNKSAVNLSQAGLTVNGQSHPETSPPAANVRKPEQDATAQKNETKGKKAKEDKVANSSASTAGQPASSSNNK